MADSHTLARPYAQAVFELAREGKSLDQWSKALATAAAFAARDELRDVMADPRVSDARRLEFFSGLLREAGERDLLGGQNPEGTNFLRLLIENDRIGVLPEIAGHFESLKAATENTLDVTVTAASEVSSAELERIRSALAARLGRTIKISTAIDQDLIGGAVIRAGDFVIDGSVRSRLAKLANALTT